MFQRCLILLALCLLLSSQAVAGTVGLAQAQKTFQVQRGTDQLRAQAETPIVISQGDRVSASEGSVQITSTNGENVLIAPRSSASFSQDGRLHLHKGEMALGVNADSQRSVEFNGLEIESLNKEGSENPSQLVMRALHDNELLIAGFGEPFAVRDASQGIQVAVLGSREALRLVKDQLGRWQPLPIPLRMQDVGNEADVVDDESVDDSDDDDEGGFLFFRSTTTGAAVVTVTAIGLGVGTYFAIDGLSDDDDDDDGDDDKSDSNPPRFRATTVTPNEESPTQF